MTTSVYAANVIAKGDEAIGRELDRLQEIITTAQRMVDPRSPLSAVLYLSPEKRERFGSYGEYQDWLQSL